MVPTLSAAQDWTRTHLREHANEHGVVQIDDLILVETSTPELRGDLTRKWLSTCGYVVDGSYVLTRTQSVGDYAAGILSIIGSPMSANDLVERFVFERSVGSLKNAMSIDDRFERSFRSKHVETALRLAHRKPQQTHGVDDHVDADAFEFGFREQATITELGHVGEDRHVDFRGGYQVEHLVGFRLRVRPVRDRGISRGIRMAGACSPSTS